MGKHEPDVLGRLEGGNARFRETVRTDERRRAKLAAAQKPSAIILGHSDSRVAPELMFDVRLGELFVIRVAGGIANRESIASAEYAVANLGTRLIIVLAHERCGAVTAAIEGGDAGENLNRLLSFIAVAVDSAEDRDVDSVARQNARINAARLTAESPILQTAVAEGRLRVLTAFFHFTTGEVEFF